MQKITGTVIICSCENTFSYTFRDERSLTKDNGVTKKYKRWVNCPYCGREIVTFEVNESRKPIV